MFASDFMDTRFHILHPQQMLTRDVQRLFVYGGSSDLHDISGVLALSDAARFRSGSCRACTAGRLLTR